MRRSNLQTSRFLLEPTPKNATLEIFVSSPTLSEEYALGKLFGIIHIESTKDEAYEIAITIRRETERRYYQGFNLKNDISIEKKFEESLAQLNQTIAELVDEHHIHIKLEEIHFLLGVMHKQDLHFTQFGNMRAYLIHKIKGKDYRPINILESTEGTKPQTSLAKLFSNIISGEIGPYDALLFCTETVTDYLSLNKLTTTIVHNSATEANAHLARLLKEIDSHISFGALILKYPSLPVLVTEKTKEIKLNVVSGLPERSIADLAHTETKTEEILSPHTTTSIKKYTKSVFSHITELLQSTRRQTHAKRPGNMPYTQTNIYQRLARKKTRFENPTHVTVRIIRRLGSFIHDALTIFSSVEKIFSTKGKKVWQARNTLGVGKKIPKKISLTLGALVLLVLMLIASSFFTHNKKSEKQINEQFGAQIEIVRQNINKADAALIYGDDENATNILLEAEKILSQILTTSQEQENEKNVEKIKVTTLLNQMRHMEEILQPKIVTTFLENITPGETNTEVFLSLVKSDTSFITLSNKGIYLYQEKDNTTTQFSLSADIRFSRFITDGTALFVTSDKNQIFELSAKDKTLKEYALGTDVASLTLTDATVYASRLYILDAKAKQISRMPRSGKSFGAAQPWLKDNIANISNASSLAIDGTIFVLFSSGDIEQYSTGTLKEKFTLAIDPALKDPTKIFTSRDTDFLYVLDPSTARLVVLTKNGKLVKQFTSPKFRELKDFVVDEKNKVIYLLDKNTIYKIPASHLP